MVDGSLVVGVIRRDGAKRMAAVMVTDSRLTSSRFINVGPAFGDDPPPVPYASSGPSGGAPGGYIVYYTHKGNEATTSRVLEDAVGTSRELRLARLNLRANKALPGARAAPNLETIADISQQADESLAFDIAWPPPPPPNASASALASAAAAADAAAPTAIVAWDEDAPRLPGQLFASRGVVKVQLALAGRAAKIVSPDSSDAEQPRLLSRKGGYFLAWLAKRPEVHDAGAPTVSSAPSASAPSVSVIEGPGESRVYRWVELVLLDNGGEPISKVHRVSSDKGRALTFDLARRSGDGGDSEPQIVVLVQDEAASTEGGGARVVRYVLGGERGERVESGDIVDGGVGASPAQFLASVASAEPGKQGALSWLSWTDMGERARIVPLGSALTPAGPVTLEPSLDGARPLVSIAPDVLVAVVDKTASAGDKVEARSGRYELARFVCH